MPTELPPPQPLKVTRHRAVQAKLPASVIKALEHCDLYRTPSVSALDMSQR
ncbi:hypothetical protein [Adonisia turfae]|uniref:hypothetical protein n=1 Tax=Adonisia turfae TaxID=2950184 RepID=UPI0013D05F78|nr:hypothetical protein [Adonisia turfae]